MKVCPIRLTTPPDCLNCDMSQDCLALRPSGYIKPKVSTLPEIAERVSITLEQVKLELSKGVVDKGLLLKMVKQCSISLTAVRGLIDLNEDKMQSYKEEDERDVKASKFMKPSSIDECRRKCGLPPLELALRDAYSYVLPRPHLQGSASGAVFAIPAESELPELCPKCGESIGNCSCRQEGK